MRKRKHIINLFAAAALLIGCSESLEDTYSDFSGDGKIHYVAMCTEVHATPRWEGLVVDWINGTDATIDKIKVIWSFEDLKDSVLLPKTSDSFELKNLADGTYRFDVCAMDKAGNESLRETTYGRPYTRQHEIMLAFTRGVVKSYFLKNKMIFFSAHWNENIEELKLKYKDTNGETQYYTFREATSNTLITIDDVSMNPADTVYVLRKGKVADCPDVIDFDPFAVSRKKIYSAGFVSAIEQRYGYSTTTKEKEEKFEEFINNVTELEFDYDIETFEDVLYCPKLQRIIFGKNRYLQRFPNTPYDMSKLLGPLKKSMLVLNKANEILGMRIDSYGPGYNAHYLGSQYIDYMDIKGYPVLPRLNTVKKEELRMFNDGNRILCTPVDPYADLDYLLDDNFSTVWETTSFTSVRTYEMMMEFMTETEIKGIKVAQPNYNPQADKEAAYVIPSAITMQTSTDGVIWKNVTFLETNILGRGSGEVTLLPISDAGGSRLVKYIKFTLRDGVNAGGTTKCKLGDVVIYK